MSKKVKETGIVLSQDTGEMAYHVEVRKSFWNKIRYGTSATVFTIIFLALMIGLNVFVGLASDRVRLSWDLTDQEIFTVSDTSINFLKSLSEEHKVEIIVLGGDETTWRESSSQSSIKAPGSAISSRKYIVETVDRYAEACEHVSVYFVDDLYNPGFLKERNLAATDHPENEADEPVMIVYSPLTKRSEYIRASVFGDYGALQFEQYLNSAIRYTTNPDAAKIALLTGHGEGGYGGYTYDDLSAFKQFLKNNGYIVEDLDLSTVSAISDEYQMIVISNPIRPYTESDIDKIRKFLSNEELEGKGMMVFADLDFCNLDSDHLRPYLEQEWRIRLEDSCIYDPSQTLTGFSGRPPLYKALYSKEASAMTGILASGDFNLYLQLGQSRPVTKVVESQQNVNLYSLLTTSEKSFSAERVSSLDKIYSVDKKQGDAVGPFDVGVLALRTRTDNLDEYATSVAVFGTTSLVDKYFMANETGDGQTTQEYMIQLVNFMAKQSSSTVDWIFSKSLKTDRLSGLTSPGQITGIWLTTIIVIPILFLAAGFVLWRIRKHL